MNFIVLSDKELFLLATAAAHLHTIPCPFCGCAHPCWLSYGDYPRHLISFEAGGMVDSIVAVQRVLCPSCLHTHAILPENTIPYASYGLLFLIRVLRGYFLHTMTVEKLCAMYRISTSTLYAWLRLFRIHKKLWLGVLADLETGCLAFLDGLLGPSLSRGLSLFFWEYSCSFLQGMPETAGYALLSKT